MRAGHQSIFARLKALLRTAAKLTVRGPLARIDQALDAFTPAESANYLAHAGYVPSSRETL